MFSFFLAEEWNIIKYILLLSESGIFVGQVKCIKQKFNRKNITYYISILHRFCLNFLSSPLTLLFTSLFLTLTLSFLQLFLFHLIFYINFLLLSLPPPLSPFHVLPTTNKWGKKKLPILALFFLFCFSFGGFFSLFLPFFTLMFLFYNIYLIAASNLHITI